MSDQRLAFSGAASSGAGTMPPGPRRMRRTGPPDSPWDGVIGHDENGSRCLLVDVTHLRGGGWEHRSASGHVAGVRDLVRREDGMDAVMPLCTQRVADFLTAREGLPLTAGEQVTLVVSMLRALVELDEQAEAGAQCLGSWWLDVDGRPLFVSTATDANAQPADAGAAALLSALWAGPGGTAGALQPAVPAIRGILSDVRGRGHELGPLEDMLFSCAQAEPLARDVLPPVRSRTVMRSVLSVDTAHVAHPRPVHAVAAAGAHETADPFSRAPRESGAGGRSVRRERLAEVTSRVTTAVWRRVRNDAPRAHTRSRALLVAGSVAAAVVVAGLLWPSGNGELDPAHAAGPAVSSVVSSAVPSPVLSAVPSATPTASASAAAGKEAATPAAEPVAGAGALLTEIATCTRVRECEGLEPEFTGDLPLPGPAGAPAAQRDLTLVDDFGGAVLMRVHARDGADADQYIVLVRHDDVLRLREVRAVAGDVAG